MDVYMQAARAMQGSLDGKGKLKHLCLQKEVQKKRATYAVAAEASKHTKLLDEVLRMSGFYDANKSFWPCLARAMVYDTLFGSGLKGDTRTGAGYAVKKQLPHFKRILGEMMKKQKLTDVSQLIAKSAPPRIPIYLRINTLLGDPNEAIKAFAADGWKMLDSPDPELLIEASRPRVGGRKRKAPAAEEEEPPKKAQKGKGGKKNRKAEPEEEEEDEDEQDRKVFYRDPMLTSLLVFPPSAKFYLIKHEILRLHKAVIQDKASCLPPYVLLHCIEMRSVLDRDNVKQKATAGTTIMGPVMDCTAAPGNKTSLLAQISRGRRPIVAIEKDDERAEVLRTRLAELKADEKVTVVNKNFLDIFPEEYPSVEGLLLDPSCSGSGIVDRIEHTQKKSEEDEAKRLKSLHDFQVSMILHGMTFPSVRRIVYSTCSINKEENEQVVQEVLSTEDVTGKWALADIMPDTWKTRALPIFQDSQNCIRYNTSHFFPPR